MDRKLTEDARIQELIQLSQASRSGLGMEFSGLRQKLDFPLRVRDSLKQQPATWLVGSVLAGLATSLLFRRRSRAKAPKSKGISGALMALTLTAARPLAKVWLTKKLGEWSSDLLARSAAPPPSPFKIKNEPLPSHVRAPGP